MSYFLSSMDILEKKPSGDRLSTEVPGAVDAELPPPEELPRGRPGGESDLPGDLGCAAFLTPPRRGEVPMRCPERPVEKPDTCELDGKAAEGCGRAVSELLAPTDQEAMG